MSELPQDFEVRGEIFMTRKGFEEVNRARSKEGLYPSYAPYPFGHGRNIHATGWSDAGIICPYTWTARVSSTPWSLPGNLPSRSPATWTRFLSVFPRG